MKNPLYIFEQHIKNNADLNIQFAIEEVQSKPIGIKVIDTSDAKSPKIKVDEEHI